MPTGPAAGARTRSPRSTSSRSTPTSGLWRRTSRACFDQLPHCLIVDEVRRRIVDKRVLALVRSFLKAGGMTETGRLERTLTGTPQGGIASPLLANIALSALDRQYQADWREMSSYHGKRKRLHRKGLPTYRLVRYADDLVL